MDAIVPLLVLAVALWARLGRGVRRRDDVERAVAETVARLRRLAADAGVPTPPRSTPRDGARTRPVASAAPVLAPTPVAPAPVAPAVRAAPVERVPPERVVPRPPASAAPAPAAAAAPAPAGAAGRRRRLDVRRDLVAAELLAAPVSLRPGGVPWR